MNAGRYQLLTDAPAEDSLEAADSLVDQRTTPTTGDHELSHRFQGKRAELVNLGVAVQRPEQLRDFSELLHLAGGGSVRVAVVLLGVAAEG